jgi:small subunit ribosomal protein S4
LSDRGIQLKEKQKVKHIYGVLERQFRRFFEMAEKLPGSTGENLLQLLERRLDNVVYRLGFAYSRSQARQLVRHGHLTVNGRKTDIPSYIVKPGDVIAWRGGSKETEYYQLLCHKPPDHPLPSWLSLDKERMIGKVLSLPQREELELKVDEKAIVEYYAR